MTPPATKERRLGRSIVAILAGFLAVVILSLGTDQVLHWTKVYPPWGERMSDKLFGIATVYRIIYGIFGSYLTARLAPYRPMLHSLTGAAVGMVLTTLATIANWNKTEMGPHWYPILLVVTALPCAWLGARLYAGRKLGFVSGGVPG